MAAALESEEQRPLAVKAESHSWGQDPCAQKCGLHRREFYRQRFRSLSHQDTPGPREAFTQLWTLCRQWLRPECYTKEQILDLLVLEQFLNILPRDLQAWVQAHHPETGEEAVTLLENLERELDEPQKQVPANSGRQHILLDKLAPLGRPYESLTVQLHPSKTQLKQDYGRLQKNGFLLLKPRIGPVCVLLQVLKPGLRMKSHPKRRIHPRTGLMKTFLSILNPKTLLKVRAD